MAHFSTPLDKFRQAVYICDMATLTPTRRSYREAAEDLRSLRLAQGLTPETLGTYMLGLSTQTADEMQAALK